METRLNKPAADLQQACFNKLVARFIRTVCCSQLVDKLLQACSRLATSLNSTALLQVVPTICYWAASQQLVNWQVVSSKLGTTWQNNSTATSCWQTCYKLVVNTTCWDFYVCSLTVSSTGPLSDLVHYLVLMSRRSVFYLTVSPICLAFLSRKVQAKGARHENKTTCTR